MKTTAWLGALLTILVGVVGLGLLAGNIYVMITYEVYLVYAIAAVTVCVAFLIPIRIMKGNK